MKKLPLLIILLATISAYAFTAYLVSSTLNGTIRYCKYSDGRIITIQGYELCPLQLN